MMKSRTVILALLAVLLAGGLGAASWLGLLAGVGGPERVSDGAPDPFGRDADELAAARAEAERLEETESVAAAGRVRLAPGEAPEGVAPAMTAPPLAPPIGRSLVDLDTNRPEEPPAPPAPSRDFAAPPAAESAALELDRAGPRDEALPNAQRAAEAQIAAIAPPDSIRSGDGSPSDVRPEFDVVRVARDGSAVLAGRAAPGAAVQVIIDGAPTEIVQADSSGEFVALIAAPSTPSRAGEGRRIDLSARNPDGRVLDSVAPIIVATPETPGEAPVALRPSADGVELLQPTARDDAGRVTIDAVTYGEAGEVMVAGRGEPGQVARLYLDNALTAEARVAPDGGWRARITREIAPAVYNLRVDQTSTAGVVTSRAETPFERASTTDVMVKQGSVVVQPGNNLWRIADFVYGDGARYTVIYGRNRDQIRDPDLIYPGQVLSLPQSADGG